MLGCLGTEDIAEQEMIVQIGKGPPPVLGCLGTGDLAEQEMIVQIGKGPPPVLGYLGTGDRVLAGGDSAARGGPTPSAGLSRN